MAPASAQDARALMALQCNALKTMIFRAFIVFDIIKHTPIALAVDSQHESIKSNVRINFSK